MNWPWNKEQTDPTKQELIDTYWLEFIDWLEDAATIRSLNEPYETYLALGNNPRKVGLATEDNFWLWYVNEKWSKNDATERAKRRSISQNNL